MGSQGVGSGLGSAPCWLRDHLSGVGGCHFFFQSPGVDSQGLTWWRTCLLCFCKGGD